MRVLMWEVDDYGNVIGVCSGRCYNSRFPYKDCICDGKNHAVGLGAAMVNVRTLFRSGKFRDNLRFADFVKQRHFAFLRQLEKGAPD